MRKIMWIVWPAFLAACAMELLVFALVDPQDLHWAGRPLGLSRQTVQTAAFFGFWAVCAIGCALTAMLGMTPDELNSPADNQ